jgi:tetratricopeptide (TPR) repeat protein
LRASEWRTRNRDRSREALAWHGAGEAYRHLGRAEESAAFHRTAAATQRELGDHWHLAIALDGLAIALHQAGEADEARQHWAEALRLLAPCSDVRAAALRTRIGEYIGAA